MSEQAIDGAKRRDQLAEKFANAGNPANGMTHKIRRYNAFCAGYDAAQAEAERKLAIAVEVLEITLQHMHCPYEGECDDCIYCKVFSALAQLRAEKPGAGDGGGE